MSSTPRLYLSPPHMGPRERELLLEAFDSNWIAPLGPQVDAFEAEFRTLLDEDVHVAALSSGTAALHLALMLVGVEPGDEVLCSSLTFAASANAIAYVGATPVFVDADEASWNLDPDLVSEYVSAAAARGRKPAAILAVDLYGQCPDFGRLRATCDQFEIPLIEDAAEALGATFAGQAAGTLGDLGVFSFNGNKIITTSGGGALVAHDPALTDRARFLATQSRDPAPHYEHSEIGYNYRLSNLLAAVGRGQLSVLHDRVAARRQVNTWYRERLADVPGLTFQAQAPWGQSSFWLTCLTLGDEAGATPSDIREACEAVDIEARHLWKPMHLQTAFEGCAVLGGERAEALFDTGLCVPSGSAMSESDVDRVVAVIRETCQTARS